MTVKQPEASLFHVKRDGETVLGYPVPGHAMTEREVGFMLGLLSGEGHFGGDGRQPQVTLRMHARHEDLFRWLERSVPGSRLYGPYHHGGRHYFQWMARGRCLREVLLPLLAANLDLLDTHTAGRVQAMCEAYGLTLARSPST